MTLCLIEEVVYDTTYLDNQDLELLTLFNEFVSFRMHPNCDWDRYNELGKIFSEMEWEEGGFSMTYRLKSPYIIKRFLEYDECIVFDNDQDILKNIHHISCYPKLVAYRQDEFMVTQFIDGNMLCTLAKSEIKKITYEKWINFFYQLVGTLKSGYLPQDIHSGNIMIDSNYDIKIIDVGAYISYSFGQVINIPKFLIEKVSSTTYLKPLFCFIMEEEFGFKIDFDYKEKVDILNEEDNNEYY